MFWYLPLSAVKEILDSISSMNPCIVIKVMGWRWEILEHPPYSLNMSLCDYDLVAKMKGLLLGTRYSTGEIIRAVWWALMDIDRSGCADSI
jgi:hypothetical protein